MPSVVKLSAVLGEARPGRHAKFRQTDQPYRASVGNVASAGSRCTRTERRPPWCEKHCSCSSTVPLHFGLAHCRRRLKQWLCRNWPRVCVSTPPSSAPPAPCEPIELCRL